MTIFFRAKIRKSSIFLPFWIRKSSVKGDKPNQFSRTSNVGDSSILRLGTSNFGCVSQFQWGIPQGSQTRSLYIKKFCPSLPLTFFSKQARANYFWRDRPNFTQFDNPTLIPIVCGGHTPKIGVLASKLTNPLHWTSMRMEVFFLLSKIDFLDKKWRFGTVWCTWSISWWTESCTSGWCSI